MLKPDVIDYKKTSAHSSEKKKCQEFHVGFWEITKIITFNLYRDINLLAILEKMSLGLPMRYGKIAIELLDVLYV